MLSAGSEALDPVLCCCWYVEVVETWETSGPGGGKGEGALSSVATGAVLGDEKAWIGYVEGGRRVGSMGEARYIKGAEAEAVVAVEAFNGEGSVRT